MIVIDQMKANMVLKGQFDKDDERTVGVFNNTKAATGIYTFQHMVNQWLYLSKGTEISEVKYSGWGIDGWIINVLTEKNKATSSKHEISLVFDKRNGIDKFWTEFHFIGNYTPTEAKLIRGNVDPFMPLCIKTEGAYSKLDVFNPVTGESEWTSKGFYRKNAKNLYDTDEEFHKWFDIAVKYSCSERISKGLLKINMEKFEETGEIELTNEVILDSVSDDILSAPASEEIKIPNKRGRKKKEDTSSTFAKSADDDFIDTSQVILED